MKKKLFSKGRALVLATLLLGTISCSGGEKQKPKVIKQESPADEILRLGVRWSSTDKDSNILSPPSPISVQHRTSTSILTLSDSKTGEEDFTLDEELDLRSGGRVRCQTVVRAPLGLRYGRSEGEAIVEITRKPVTAQRRCDGPHPNPTVQLEGGRSVLRLTSDTLRVVEPKVDQRIFIPVVE